MAQTTYDPDADEHPIHHVSEHTPDDAELRQMTGINPEQEAAIDQSADIAQREGNLFNPGGDGDSSAASAGELAAGESAAGGGEGGGLYRDEPQKKRNTRPGKKLSARSNAKKRLAIAGAAAGGSLIVGIIAFLALLPLKIESLVKNLEGHYFATTQNAIDKETENEFNQFVAKEVLPNFFTRTGCVSTIDPSCVSLAQGAGPVDKLYQSWKQGNLEQKLATQYGIVIGRKGGTSTGQLYMNLGGKTLDEKQLNQVWQSEGKISLFDLAGTDKASTNQVRSAVRDALKNATFYDKVYFRYKVGKLLETKYGIKRCVIACDVRDKFNDAKSDKLNAAKGYLVERVISPYSQSANLVIQCLISGGCDADSLKPSDNPEDNEKVSGFQQQLNGKLEQYAATYGSKKLATLVEYADGISKDGFGKWIFTSIVKNFWSDAAGDTAGTLADGAGTINMIAQVVQGVNNAAKDVKKLNYAIDAAAAVQTYMTFRTVADEVHSGHMDSTELGSFTSQLDNGSVDATSTPLYNQLFGGGTSTATTTAFLGGLTPSAYADSTNPSNGTYKCRNNSPVPKSQTVCSEEVFDGGSGVVNTLNNITKSIPLWSQFSTLASGWNNTVGKAMQAVGSATSAIMQFIPGFSDFQNFIGKALNPLISLVTGVLITNPLQDAVNANTGALPSGGRTFDMMAGGADVAGNKSCQVQLGCAALTPAQVANIQNQQVQINKVSFDRQSMFARIFSTSTPYSLVSRLSMDMPSSLTSAFDSGLASLLSNPFGKITSLFSSLFSTNRAFAASQPGTDPFGVIQYGYTDNQIPPDPQAYWDQNCTGSETTNWENNQQQDPNTGEPVATTTNACLLINSSAQSAGATFDSSMLPPGSLAASFGGSGSSAAGSGNYSNPFHDETHLTPSRVDEGVDYASTTPVPIYAIGNGVVTLATNKSSFFTASDGNADWITYQLTDGPASGKYVYVSESCPPLVQVGQTVNASTVLCNVQPASIETGWALDGTSQAAAAYGSYTQGHATAYGQNYQELMDSLGVKTKACYDHPGEALEGALPSGWPTWISSPSLTAGLNTCS